MTLLTELRPYQRKAVEKARGHHGFAFFPEQRTGKILISLAVVEERRPTALLIICPKNVIPEWQRQLEQHIDFDWGIEAYILNYEQLVDSNRRKAWRKWAKKQRHLMMIVDESHRIKKRGSTWSKAVRGISRYATDRLALTGTPVAQGLHDAWAQFNYIDPTIFGTYAEFEAEYVRTYHVETDSLSFKKILGFKNQAKFEKIFHEHCYRITLNEARGQGTKIRKRIIPVQLTTQSRSIYDRLESDLETEVGEQVTSVLNILGLAMKLQQVCGGHLLTDEGEWLRIGAEKLIALEVLLTQLNEPVVICARFLQEIADIEALVRKRGMTYRIIKGGEPLIGDFKEDVAIVQIQSGVGIDLSHAKTLIFYSCDYSYINHDQIRFRIQSYSTIRIDYYYLIAENTVDEDIYRVVRKKENFVDIICDKYRRRHHGRKPENPFEEGQAGA